MQIKSTTHLGARLPAHLTYEQCEAIRAAYTAGATKLALAEQWKCTQLNISEALWALGGNPRNTRCKVPVDQHATIIARYTSGDSAETISKDFGVTNNTILGVLKRHQVPVRNLNTNKVEEILTPSTCKEIVSVYLEGESTLSIASRLGVTKSAVRHVLIKHKTTRRSMSDAKRKHTFDPFAFSNPNADGRYWIGMLMADGSVSLRKYGSPLVRLGLALGDVEHVKMFQRYLKSTHKLTISPPKQNVLFLGKHLCNTQGAVELQIASKQLVEDLIHFGVVPGKTKRACVNHLEQDRDFWRGVIDGDGSLGWYNRTYVDGSPYRIPFLNLATSSEELMGQFYSFIQPTIPGCRAKPHYTTPRLMAFTIAGKYAIQAIRLLYDQCQTSLERKLKIAGSIINHAGAKQ